MSCIVVLDGRGDIYALPKPKYQLALPAAKALVEHFCLDDRPGDWIHYTVVEETDDPELARVLGRGRNAMGSFQIQ